MRAARASGGSMGKADSTLRSSQAVPHPSTNRALCRLTSEVRRDPVHSTRYGRQRTVIAFIAWAPIKKFFTLLDLCVSSLRRGHANLLCIVPILTDDPRRESKGSFETHVLPSPRQGGCGVPCRGILKTVGRHVALFREAHLTTHHRLHGAAML